MLNRVARAGWPAELGTFHSRARGRHGHTVLNRVHDGNNILQLPAASPDSHRLVLWDRWVEGSRHGGSMGNGHMVNVKARHMKLC